MQQRSKAYQAALYFVREGDPVWGIAYHTLVGLVRRFIDEDWARDYRLSRLKKAPSETDAATITKGQEAIARKYIDSAHRTGIIDYYGPFLVENPQAQRTNHLDERTVLWNRPARTGGTYSTSDNAREEEQHAAFNRYLRTFKGQ